MLARKGAVVALDYTEESYEFPPRLSFPPGFAERVLSTCVDSAGWSVPRGRDCRRGPVPFPSKQRASKQASKTSCELQFATIFFDERRGGRGKICGGRGKQGFIRCRCVATSSIRMSVRVQQGLAVAAATVAGTAYASRHLDRQRRPLQGFNAPTMSAVLTSLRTSGVGVVDGVVDRGLISAVQATSVFRQMPKQMPKRLRERPPREWRLSALGRYHRRMDEGEVEESDVQVFEQVEQRIWPLVDAFFKEEDEASTEGIFRSEMQVC